MKSRMKTGVLAWVMAGAVSGAAAQEDCSAKIDTLKTVADIQGALGCVQGLVAAEARARQQAEKGLKQLPQQVAEQLEMVATKVRHVSLKEATNGAWKQIPESDAADACFLSSVRLPPQGLCQVTYQGPQALWTYNISDRAGAGFLCTATCVWMDVRRKPEAAQ